MAYKQVLRALWIDWAIALAAPIVLVLVSLVVIAAWLPAMAFVLAAILHTLYKRSLTLPMPGCSLLTLLMTRVMLWAAVIMLVMALCYRFGILIDFFGHADPSLPYIPALVLGPLSTIFSGYYVFRGSRSAFYRRCQIIFGSPAELGTLGTLYSHEGRYQVSFFFRISVALTIVTSIYYWVFYIDTDINSPDRFVFVWLPTIFNGLAVLFLAKRYANIAHSLAAEARREPSETGHLDGLYPGKANASTVRFIIVDDQHFYFAPLSSLDGMLTEADIYDAPVTLTLPYRRDLQLDEAKKLLSQALGTEDFALRHFYTSVSADDNSNTFHFIARIEKPSIPFPHFTPMQTSRLIDAHRLTSLLATEIHRLYTITMAWKTYDIHGRRLYKIKNYKPVFRLEGIINWRVDFNDRRWLEIAMLNQDHPLYRLRRFLYLPMNHQFSHKQ